MNQYIIHYKKQPLEELVNAINLLKGLPLSEMTVKDLVFDRLNGLPIRTGNGVYIFKNLERTYYIGNCVARNFVERVPAHFDIRHNGWFNSLLKAIIKYNNIQKEEIDQNDYNNHLEFSARFAFDNLNLILINFSDYNKNEINNLENLLATKLKPINTRFRKLNFLL